MKKLKINKVGGVKNYLVSYFVLLFVVGCASVPPSMNSFDEALQNSQIDRAAELAWDHFMRYAELPYYSNDEFDGSHYLSKKLKSNKDLANEFVAVVNTNLQSCSSLKRVSALDAAIDLIQTYDVAQDPVVRDLREELLSCSAEAHLKGDIQFLARHLREGSFPFLKSGKHLEMVVDKEVELASEDSERSLDEIGVLLRQPSVSPELKHSALKRLQDSGVSSDRFGDIKDVVDEFGGIIGAEYVIPLYVEYSPRDDVALFDLMSLLDQNPFIEVVSTESKAKLSLHISQVILREREIPEKVETIRYSTLEIDAVTSTLYMPKNSTYMFDLKTGGYELRYAYSFEILEGGRVVSSDRISGEKSESYKDCANQRVQNVFGGVSQANFVANEHMRRICAGSSSRVDIDKALSELSQDIYMVILDQEPIRQFMTTGNLEV